MPGTDRTIFPEKVQDKNGNEKGGLLSFVGDPAGKALNTGLKPIGAGVGALTGSVAEGASSVTNTARESVGIPDRGVEAEREELKKDKLGGKEQNAENPMGL